MALEDADKQTIAELIASALKTDREDREKAAKTSLAKLSTELEAKIKAAIPKAEEKVEGEESEEVVEQPKVKESQADKRMQARIAKLEAETKAAKDAQLAAENESKTNRLLGSARDALAEAGVKNMKAALAILHNTEGRLKFDESGAPGIHFKRDGYEEVVPMAQAVEEWLKTDDGMAVLPAKNLQGTGTGNAGSGASVVTSKGEINVNELGNKLGAALANARF